ncbi:unnamed protein product [Rotaria sordida]|uniref:Uncharacterized protein n=1 Tax=Rotaria sordida TaxID=392033 RepID=A0A813NT68_9BILA|nr:unnamed protein product [Rotaria sordida]CAF0899074.1 unnamed protein product [Rotaria sordida]CAF0904936.1 unnamed protein product [Rotaria sordida]CAF0924373.1 unnamed protein product [Rotaria sordida]CAF3493656.1 unnamed protein product [Rotaria sordida]
MGLFYSLINSLISNNEQIQKPCGQPGCCSLYPHVKQQKLNSQSTLPPNIIAKNNSIYPSQIYTELSMNNSNICRTSSIKRNQRRIISKNKKQTRRRK